MFWYVYTMWNDDHNKLINTDVTWDSYFFFFSGENIYDLLGFPGGSDCKELAFNVGNLGSIPGSGRSQEKGMATHSSILAWELPWSEEPGGLQSKGSQKPDITDWLTILRFTNLANLKYEAHYY